MSTLKMQQSGLPEGLEEMLGPKGLLTGEEARNYGRDFMGEVDNAPLAVLRPETTEQVAEALRICTEHGLSVVPQGGRTGLTGAGVPSRPNHEVILCLARMNKVRWLDDRNHAMAVDAGCILADVQKAAADANRLFPLSYGAEGSCQIGGSISTNAGGTAVLRYGNTRDLILGLEVVLADGTVLDMMRALRKDNTGIDLKQLFIGSEGILGVVTGAVLKLYPAVAERECALLAFPSLSAVMQSFAIARESTNDRLSAFEMMPQNGITLACNRVPDVVDPVEGDYPWYALLEVSASKKGSGLQEMLEGLIERLMEEGLVLDGTVSSSESQRAQLWRIREALVEAHNDMPHLLKHDVSVPISDMADFIETATEKVHAIAPDAMLIAFGHVGDGNVHFNICHDEDNPNGSLATRKKDVTRAVYDLVQNYRGSFSAEHGVGSMKRDALRRYRSEAEIAVMVKLKKALDPEGLLNPGKVL